MDKQKDISLIPINKNIFVKANVKYASAFTILMQSLILMTIGILILCSTKIIFSILSITISSLILIYGIIELIKNIFNKSKDIKKLNIILSILYIITGIYFLIKPETFKIMIPLLFTFYIAVESIISSINTIIAFENNLKHKKLICFKMIVTHIFLLILLFYPLLRDKVTIIIASIYFIILGFSYLLDSIYLMLSDKIKNKVKKRIKITLPVFISAFIPFTVLKKLNKIVKVKEVRKIIISKKEEKHNVEVLIHIKDLNHEIFGHVDLCIDGIVYSYESYDENKVKFNSSIGDGVLFKVDKEKYIDYCINNEHKNIIVYGLKLNEKIENNIRNKINSIFKNTYRWLPLNEENNVMTYTDYASRLYTGTHAEFYKFKNSSFKTYFVLSTNCVKLANEIIGSKGVDILNVNGFITPGTYYDYFNREFKRKDSFVCSKEIFLNNTKK